MFCLLKIRYNFVTILLWCTWQCDSSYFFSILYVGYRPSYIVHTGLANFQKLQIMHSLRCQHSSMPSSLIKQDHPTNIFFTTTRLSHAESSFITNSWYRQFEWPISAIRIADIGNYVAYSVNNVHLLSKRQLYYLKLENSLYKGVFQMIFSVEEVFRNWKSPSSSNFK